MQWELATRQSVRKCEDGKPNREEEKLFPDFFSLADDKWIWPFRKKRSTGHFYILSYYFFRMLFHFGCIERVLLLLIELLGGSLLHTTTTCRRIPLSSRAKM